MVIDTKNLISITEANQNFSKVAKKVDEEGSVVILKNNKPKYVLIEYDPEILDLEDDEKIDIVTKRVLKRFLPAFKELAKED